MVFVSFDASFAVLGTFCTLGSLFSLFGFGSFTFGASWRQLEKTRLITVMTCWEISELSSYPEFPRRARGGGGFGRPHQSAVLDAFFQGSPDQVLQSHQIHGGVFLFDMSLDRLWWNSFSRVQLFKCVSHHDRGGGMGWQFAHRRSI